MRWSALPLVVGLVACGSSGTDGPSEQGELGGQSSPDAGANAGGKVGTGGATGTGGKIGTGGSKGTGGATSTGGSKGTGGATGTGGASGTGGATGTGGGAGGPPHVVGACDGLGAVNTWETATPPGIRFVGSVVVDPVHAGTLYVGTGAEGTSGPAQGIHKSTDCGATWAKVSTGRNGNVFDAGTMYGITVDWAEPDVLYSAALYGSDNSLFKSTNGGVDWDTLFPQGSEVANTVEYNFTQEFSIDPTDHRHLAVTFHAPCKGAYAPMCLGETRDSGATWHLFKGPLGGWGENARPIVLGNKSLLFVSWADGVYYTADSSAAVPVWQKVAPGGGHGAPAENGNWYLTSYTGIYRSGDGGGSFTLIPGSPQSYTIASDGQRLFAAGNAPDNFNVAQQSADTKWQSLNAPSTPDRYITLAYDTDHHILYSANHNTGLIRMVTR